MVLKADKLAAKSCISWKTFVIEQEGLKKAEKCVHNLINVSSI